ncbi:MAG: hypothetical protein LIO76_08315 [Clostridiales bacterium]|nr:hypothetical protein [Clostridiales bacterium]
MKKLRKMAAFVLTAALLVQQCAVTGSAEESPSAQTQAVTEAQTQAATEAQTQAVTEAQTQASTEAQTQAATEAQTQAATEAQTQAATEAQTQTSTEAQTKAAAETQTSTETEAKTSAETETEAEAQTEAQTSETESSETEGKTAGKQTSKETTEKETERSDRKNTGDKLKLSDLVKQLSSVLPYLFVGETVTLPAALTASEEQQAETSGETAVSEEAAAAEASEETESGDAKQSLEELLADGDEGKALLANLKKLSIRLADARSSKSVTVINIYADEDGNLDEAQLEALSEDRTLDVTDTVYVINVVANSAAQKFTFSGYTMKRSGKTVEYADAYEAGDVIYNFVALEEDGYTDYTGKLILSDGIQGTVLAPAAAAEAAGDLSGAVYAKTVTVKDADAALLRVAFSTGAQEETESTEAQTESSETETETETETSKAETETETETSETETETETESVSRLGSGLLAALAGGISTVSGSASEPAATAETETETGSETETETETETQSGDKKITVSAQALFGDTLLTAEQDAAYYAALFTAQTGTAAAAVSADADGTAQTAVQPASSDLVRVSGVQTLTLSSGETGSGSVTFDSLTAGTYYVAATDKDGNLLQLGTAASPYAAAVEVTLAESDTEKTVTLQYQYTEDSWTEGAFSCTVPLTITLNVLDRDGTALAGNETFYVNIYADADRTKSVSVYTDSTLTEAANSTPIAISMDGGSTQTVSVVLKVTAAEQTFYIGETDSSGTAVTGGENEFAYNVSYPDSDANAVTVQCGDTAAAVTVQNQLNDSTIRISVRDASDGGLLSGAKLAVKDSSGSIYEVSAVGSKTFTSGGTEIVWTNALEDGETYYLTEITAPDGYTPVPDVEFTVVRGCTTEVVIENTATASTGYSLTVTKQVYVGDDQVYAYDTTSGTYQAKGAYTYYFALFSDSARKYKVSNVVSLDVSGFTGTVTFSNLTKDGVYYLSETDQYGVVKSSTSSLTIRYTNSGKVTMSEKTRSMVAQNVYKSLPGGYRYTGTLSMTLNVTDSSGTAEAVTNTFYIGIYRNSDYSDTPTVVKMSLSNASSVTVRRRILLSGENSMTYYIAEVDASGNRITDSSDFSYVVSVDKPSVTISKGSTQSVTVTNKLKASKVTLYLTKRVYEGTTLKAVSETFYVGLFKDSALTQLYADPIAMTLNNASEKTLKLTLNLGSASGVTIYIAEVDKDGNVITDQRSFGYQIKVVNATAAFTQDNLSIQTVLLNSVYGTTSSEDWDTILNAASSDLLSGSDSYTVDDNGSVSGEASSVQTGDDTPLFGYILLMGAALLVFGVNAWRRRRLTR